MFSPKVSKITIENFGGNGFTALKDNENDDYNSCIISRLTETPFSGSKNVEMNSSLNADFSTKFYIVSISALGLLIFYKLLLK